MSVNEALLKESEVKAAIEQLNSEYAHCIDDDRLEDWPDFFTDDCVYRVIARDNYARNLPASLIFCNSKGMLKDRIVAHRHANIFEKHYYRHIIGNSMILGQENGVYRAQTNYAVFITSLEGDTEVYNTGKYADKIVMENGKAKLKERTVVYDTLRIPTLLVTPI